ncbi:LysR substrate-binding domain-containing protein [Streptomyces sp. NPDC058067]|uniref:LysR family transcriptional regulator n=1 Tax=Streptomyces antnestii TaxID=2494256 RepID=A0A3S2W0C0_9ACTN|nr:LysR family transcriptional regulator [Streptomyces sp. San01]RVU28046.1 LysR family transcriptional regulator [Streptomyces sp. San01]
MELNLHRLCIFLKVVEHQGFSAAAHELYMSQPSVSNQVRRLEQSLNVTLVDRSGARTRPTAEGEVLAEYAKRIFLLADEAVAAVQQVSSLEKGRLMVGGSTTVGTYLLPTLLARFQERYPGVECDVFVGNNRVVAERLLAGDIGIAVVAGGPAEPQLLVEPVLEERLVLVARASHPLAGVAAPLAPGALSGERFLMREPGSHTRSEQERVLEEWGLAGQATRSDVWGPEAVKQCVAAGLGVALISEHAIVDDVQQAGSLAVLPVHPSPQPRHISLVRRRDRLLSPAEQAFVRLLRSPDGRWARELTEEGRA